MIDNHDRNENVTTNETLCILIQQLRTSENKIKALIQKGTTDENTDIAIKINEDLLNVLLFIRHFRDLMT